uniref:Low molecular weight phosphotyrosine protein phosphatase n=1 Tax=Ascaris suum TaxID=6253 RepID=F1LE52_ASCSU
MATASSSGTPSKHKSVLFVCLGNICRSPMAEAIFVDTVKKNGLFDEWTIDSAALIDYHVGMQPDKRAIRTLNKFGISDYKHKARQVTTEDFRTFDYIMGMDENNMKDLREIEKLAGDGKAVVEMFGVYDTDGEAEVSDPYYESDIGAFERVFEQLTRCCTAFLDKHK